MPLSLLESSIIFTIPFRLTIEKPNPKSTPQIAVNIYLWNHHHRHHILLTPPTHILFYLFVSCFQLCPHTTKTHIGERVQSIDLSKPETGYSALRWTWFLMWSARRSTFWECRKGIQIFFFPRNIDETKRYNNNNNNITLYRKQNIKATPTQSLS